MMGYLGNYNYEDPAGVNNMCEFRLYTHQHGSYALKEQTNYSTSVCTCEKEPACDCVRSTIVSKVPWQKMYFS